jgi:hypothetical protein
MAYPASKKELATINDLQTPEPIFPAVLETKVGKTIKALGKITALASDEDRALADALIKDGKEVQKEVETIRFSFTKPLDDQKKSIMDLQKALISPLDTHVVRLTGLVNTFIKEQYRAAEAERQRLQKEEADKLKRLRSPDSIAKVQQATEEAIAQVAAPTAGVRMDTKYELQDINKVNRALLMLDPEKVKQAIARGERDLAGIRIWQEPARSGR